LSGEGTIQIALSNNQLLFELENVVLISRIVEGHFPNYEQVIPKQEKTKSTAARETLLAALRRASLLASPESQAVKMDFSKAKIILSSKSPAFGESKEEVDAEVTGQDLAIGFNPHYLMDALKNLEVEQVSLSLSDSDKPGVLQGKEGYLYVIMPMQLN
jgi:DNA polymerase-3 subunit beta